MVLSRPRPPAGDGAEAAGLPSQPDYRPQPQKGSLWIPIAHAHIPRLQRCRLHDDVEAGPSYRAGSSSGTTGAWTDEEARHDHRVNRHGAGFTRNRLRTIVCEHFLVPCCVSSRPQRPRLASGPGVSPPLWPRSRSGADPDQSLSPGHRPDAVLRAVAHLRYGAAPGRSSLSGQSSSAFPRFGSSADTDRNDGPS